MDLKLIHRVPKLYPKKSCDKLIKYFEDNINKAERGGFGPRKLNNLEMPLNILNTEDYFYMGKSLLDGINDFKKKCPHVDKYIMPWRVESSAQLCKYKPNNYYSTIHCENDGGREHLTRVFAWMFFLNDIKKGGGTEFILQKYIAKPKAGDFYIWPAYWSHLHRGVNAPKETKYILTGWCKYI
tara:strand:+ start:306 stop:854 length:549 start_codon:yes stop_codon:yes gene_type:complete